jgi:hypothetical protein
VHDLAGPGAAEDEGGAGAVLECFEVVEGASDLVVLDAVHAVDEDQLGAGVGHDWATGSVMSAGRRVRSVGLRVC